MRHTNLLSTIYYHTPPSPPHKADRGSLGPHNLPTFLIASRGLKPHSTLAVNPTYLHTHSPLLSSFSSCPFSHAREHPSRQINLHSRSTRSFSIPPIQASQKSQKVNHPTPLLVLILHLSQLFPSPVMGCCLLTLPQREH